LSVSTLLEALKKSERARRLGRAPVYREVRAPAPSAMLRWVSLAAILMLIAVLGWSAWLIARPPAVPPGPVAAEVVAAPSDPPAANPPPSELPASSSSGPVTAGTSIEKTGPALSGQTPTASPSTAPRASAAPREPRPRAAGQVPWLSSLPAGFRERLPPLVINIHVYSPDKSQRILYINNRPCKPGEDIGGGVVVEDILPDGVLLRAHGQQFKLPRPT
jgi:hypothetical protein